MGATESTNPPQIDSSTFSMQRIPSSELFCLNERELLSKLFKNLVQRSQHPRCIDKATFCRVFPLPGVLGDRLFKVFDSDNTELITYVEFFDGIAIILKGSIEDKVKLLFAIMDLDEQQKISQTDLETVLNCIVSAQQSWLHDNEFIDSPKNIKSFDIDNEQNTTLHRTKAVMEIDCETIVAELLEDAFAHCPSNSKYLTLRIFTGWIVEHVYLWQIIEDTFKLNSTCNISLTPGLRRRRSESLSSMASATSVISNNMQLLHAPHANNEYDKLSKKNNDHLLIDNVLKPKEPFSNQLHIQRVSSISYKSLNSEQEENNTSDSQYIPHAHPPPALLRTKSLFGFKYNMSEPSVPDMHGYLNKIGKRLSFSVKRWYLLHSNFLYVFKSATDTKPRHVILLQGCQIKAYDKNKEKYKENGYGIELVIGINTIRHQKKILYAASKREQYQWISALKQSADAFVIDDFFNIHEKLGCGKFSTVYRATDKKNNSNNQYAVKIIQRRSLSPRENKALRTEIAVLRLLNHPNVISIQHVFETIENICIVMQYVKGGDLFDRIVEHKRFPESTAKLVLYKLLKVILYLHKRGIVHRDLKPENILCLNKNKIDDILVIDFGLSSFFTPKELLKSPCGTLSYVAPEVLKGYGYGKEVDLWSAGVILYVMIRGKLPFDSNIKKDKTNLIRKVISGRFSMRNEIWKLRSNNCKDLIIRLLCVDPQKRLNAINALKHPWFNTLNNSEHDINKSLKPVPESQNEENENDDNVADNNNNDISAKNSLRNFSKRTQSI